MSMSVAEAENLRVQLAAAESRMHPGSHAAPSAMIPPFRPPAASGCLPPQSATANGNVGPPMCALLHSLGPTHRFAVSALNSKCAPTASNITQSAPPPPTPLPSHVFSLRRWHHSATMMFLPSAHRHASGPPPQPSAADYVALRESQANEPLGGKLAGTGVSTRFYVPPY